MKQIQDMMHSTNTYVQLLKCTYEKCEEIHSDVRIHIRDSVTLSIYRGRTNAPTSDEVALFVTGNTSNRGCDIITECKLLLFMVITLIVYTVTYECVWI